MATGGLQIAGAIIGLVGQGIAADAQQKAYVAQATTATVGENVREQQMQFETVRKRRQAVREAVVARSMSITAGANQGALQGSGVAGGAGTATAAGAENQQTAVASEILGSRVFLANKAYHFATANAQAAVGLGQGIGSVGQALFNSAPSLNNIFGGSRTVTGGIGANR